MKKLLFFLMTILLVALSSSQIVAQEAIYYGTVEFDGYQNIKLGASWSKRPEAKMIYNGSCPPGYTVYILDQDYIIRFADGECNDKDNNYIVVPKGEKVYSDKSGFYYFAKCGNKIVFIKPVGSMEEIERVPDVIDVDNNDTVYKYIYGRVEQPIYVTMVTRYGYVEPYYYQTVWCPTFFVPRVFLFSVWGDYCSHNYDVYHSSYYYGYYYKHHSSNGVLYGNNYNNRSNNDWNGKNYSNQNNTHNDANNNQRVDNNDKKNLTNRNSSSGIQTIDSRKARVSNIKTNQKNVHVTNEPVKMLDSKRGVVSNDYSTGRSTNTNQKNVRNESSNSEIHNNRNTNTDNRSTNTNTNQRNVHSENNNNTRNRIQDNTTKNNSKGRINVKKSGNTSRSSSSSSSGNRSSSSNNGRRK
jgi:hypothetical protein